MKLRTASISIVILSLVGVAVLFVLPSVFSANMVYPEIYSSNANRDIVNTGLQPESSPLILSVRIGVGGIIDRVTVNLEDLSGARFYHPGSNSMRNTGYSTPMQRVYKVDDKEAYLISNDDDEYEDNRYITAISHQMVEGWAEKTNKWQVELMDTGYRTGNYRLRVQAVNRLNHASTAIIPLQIVQDQTGPVITLETDVPDSELVACPGEMLALNAAIHDDLSGTFSVRLAEHEFESLFNENYTSMFSHKSSTETWYISNLIRHDTPPGHYQIEISAVDYAGNSSTNHLWLEVVPYRSSFQIDLKEGWNLVSVPASPESSSVESVFSGTSIISVLTVVESQHIEPTQMEPGRGYLVKSTKPVTVTVDLAAHNPSMIPPMINLKPGWNLIGYASPGLEPAMPLTQYLGSDLKGKWIAIFTEDGSQARAKSTSPYVWAVNSFPTGRDYPFSGYSEDVPVVELGKGYWIYVVDEGVLIP